MVAFDTIFEPVYDKPCWNANAVHGSFLSMEFGDKHLWVRDSRVAAPTGSGQVDPNENSPIYSFHGAWHLWFYRCDWQVFSGKTVIGDSSTELGIRRAAARLEGKMLKRVTISADGYSVFQFDRYHKLETNPHSSNTEQWFLYETATFQVLTCFGNGQLDYHQNENCYEDADQRIIAAAQAATTPTASTLILQKRR